MYSKNAKKKCQYKIPTVFCMAIFLHEGFVYNVVFLLKVLAPLGWSRTLVLLGLPFNLLWALAVWAFWRTSLTDPGRITEEFSYFVKTTPGVRTEHALEGGGWQPGKLTKGRKSPEIRPERAHFCQVCEQDILRMDHFCPWTGNCVGFRNHKFFVQLIVYGFLAASWAVLTPFLFLMALEVVSKGTDLDLLLCHTDWVFLAIFEVVGFLVAIFFFFLSFHHVPLAWENKTSIEDLYENMENPYEQRSRLKNLEEVFGVFGWDWFLPVLPRRPVSDGFSFRRTDEQVPESILELMETDLTTGTPTAAGGFESLFEDIDGQKELWKFRYGVGQRHDVDEEGKGWFAETRAWLLGS